MLKNRSNEGDIHMLKNRSNGGVMPLCDEWLALIRKTKRMHTAAEGCEWTKTDTELLCEISSLFERSEICKAA